jgi:hypothetical protein
MSCEGQGCKEGANASLLARICRHEITYAEVLQNIDVVQEDLLRVQDETASSSDLQTFKINRHKEHRLHFLLRLLERAEMRLMLAEYKSIFTTQLTTLEHTMLEKVQKLENKVRELSRKTEVSEHVANEALDMASTVESALQATNEELATSREAVEETVKQLKSLTRSVDVIDNRARANNAIVYGLHSVDPRSEVTSLLTGQQDLQQSVQVAHYVGKKLPGQVSRPALVKFSTAAEKERFLRWSRKKPQQLTATSDMTQLRVVRA